jgi:hypothetical protein
MPLLYADANGLSAIDHHRMPSREGAIRRTEPQDCGRDLFRLAQTSDRLLSNHAIVPIGCARGDTLDHRRVDDSGADRVHADVAFGVIERSTFGQTGVRNRRSTFVSFQPTFNASAHANIAARPAPQNASDHTAAVSACSGSDARKTMDR